VMVFFFLCGVTLFDFRFDTDGSVYQYEI